MNRKRKSTEKGGNERGERGIKWRAFYSGHLILLFS